MSEHQEQAAFFDWLKTQETRIPCLSLFHAIPNGGNRNIVTAKKLKREGVKKGVLDTFLPVSRGGYHGLYIEFKSPKHDGTKSGGVSKEQAVFLDAVKDQGYAVYVAYTWAQAVAITTNYINTPLLGVHECLETIDRMQAKLADALHMLAKNDEGKAATIHNATTFELCKEAIKRGEA